MLALGVAVAVPDTPAAAETDCKSWLFGICTSHNTLAEQAVVDAQRRLVALLRDPARAAPELEKRLRGQVHYSNGLLLIEDPILHGITTLPATTGWAIDCGILGVAVTFGATGENGANLGDRCASWNLPPVRWCLPSDPVEPLFAQRPNASLVESTASHFLLFWENRANEF
jgi:hypothetical protein